MKITLPAFLFLLFAGFCLSTGAVYGQTPSPGGSYGYSPALQRLQLKFISSYVYFALFGRADPDSVAHLVSEGEGLDLRLYYNEDLENVAEGPVKLELERAAFFLFKAGALKSDLDSSLGFLTAARTDADRSGNIYSREASLAFFGKYYQQAGDEKRSFLFFTQAVSLARTANDRRLLLQALANRGTFSRFDDPTKEKDLNEALGLAEGQKDMVREIEMRTRIYEIYFVKHEFDTVRKQLLQVTNLERGIHYQHLNYNHAVMAFLEYQFGDYAAMFANEVAAVSITDSLRDFAFSNFLYASLATGYSLLDNNEQTLAWCRRCMDQEKVNKIKQVWYTQYLTVLFNMISYGRDQQVLDLALKAKAAYPPVSDIDKLSMARVLAMSYSGIGRRDLASKYYEEMLTYVGPVASVPWAAGDIIMSYLEVANFYIGSGETVLARRYVDKASRVSDGISLHDQGRINWLRYKIDSSEGNWASALTFYKLSREIDDSLFNIDKNKKIAQLQIQFETQNKDKNLELLTQKEQLQEARVRQSNITRDITLAGAFVLIVIIGLILLQYRSKQISNRQINEKNVALEQLVKDKDWLVKEIHHRVKNNLQTIVSLLESQSHTLKDDALEAVVDSRNRIYAMSLIHQKLYQREFDSSIDLSFFLPELVDNLRKSFDVRTRIRFILDIENIVLDVSQATPVGLILNEAVINAIKYAFPGRGEGNEITVVVRRGLHKDVEFEIADNGIGLPGDLESRVEAGLGIKLMRGLAGELHGEFRLSSSAGTKIAIRFSPKPGFDHPALGGGEA